MQTSHLVQCGVEQRLNGDDDNNNDDDDDHRKEEQQERRSIEILTSSLPERLLKANDRAFNDRFKYADNFIQTAKYNIISFLPLNLIEQFQRLANFYFLMLMLLQFVPWISSISWYSTAVPLAIVLGFSAAKEAYDDIQRHRSDSQVNNRISYVVRNGQLIEEKWMNVKVGDIIRMENGQFVAADLLLLSTSEPYGICYIETAELDGETNLKARQALLETYVMGDKLSLISEFKGEIRCEQPNNKLDHFEGNLAYSGKTFPLNNEKMLLRGCVLRNTRWCYGVVVFAGRDTKLMMNGGKSSFKRTSLDRFLNILIMGIVLFLVAMCLICTILCGIWEWTTGRYFTVYLTWDWSIIPRNEKSSEQIAIISFFMFFSYLILLNTVVPISLYVSVEIIRFVHSMWINFDCEMYYEKSDVAARARTTTLNEELGQVQYIFSDKTGTLTQNIMTFKKCSINGQCYGDLYNEHGDLVEIKEDTPAVDFSTNSYHEPFFKFYDQTLLAATENGIIEVTEFWRLLSLCHTVMPDRKSGRLLYQAQSPDEAALTSAARNFGYVFKSRTANTITLEVNGFEEEYNVLGILDFNNIRKRMSVIVKNADDEIVLYCKGADTVIFERMSPKVNELLKSKTTQHLDRFASDGLRTLCLAWKKLDVDYFNDWHKRQKDAAVQLLNRQERLNRLYEEIEQDLMLLGATAIEDKLQDGVSDTIAELARANIKIWVLTGDKQETAINIGYSCRLLTEDMREVFVIDGETESEVEVQLKGIRRRIEQDVGSGAPHEMGKNAVQYTNAGYIHSSNGFLKATTEAVNFALAEKVDNTTSSNIASHVNAENASYDGFALVISGQSLTHALKRNLQRTFLDIGCLCQAVVCCRVTPLQKAMVVDLVKRNKKAITLAIGDGANDVLMIKTAHIGVGISGEEGMQAVLASDYSIGQFRYLHRLLLVHGRWSYLRMAKFLRYFFYKNFAFTLTNFWYSFFCGYSAQTVFDQVFIASYNLFFTALPVLAMGIFDQDLNDNYSLMYPKLYMPGQHNLFFNMRIFIYSVLHGMVSSLVIFFIPYGTLSSAVGTSGSSMNDYSLLAFTCFTALIVVVTGQIMFDTSYWTVFTHLVIWGSLIFYVVLAFLIYEVLPIKFVARTQTAQSYGVFFQAVTSLRFWLSLIMVSVILLLPVMMNRFFWLDTHPSYADRLRLQTKLPKGVEKMQTKVLSRVAPRPTTAARAQHSLRSGYAFSHQQGFGELITKGKLFKQIEQVIHYSSPQLLPRKHAPPILQLAEKGMATTSSPVPSRLSFNESSKNKSLDPQQINSEERKFEGNFQTSATCYKHSILVNEDNHCGSSESHQNVILDAMHDEVEIVNENWNSAASSDSIEIPLDPASGVSLSHSASNSNAEPETFSNFNRYPNLPPKKTCIQSNSSTISNESFNLYFKPSKCKRSKVTDL